MTEHPADTYRMNTDTTTDRQPGENASDGRGVLRQRWDKIKSSWTVFALISVLNAWPLFWFPYAPFVDHPSHLFNARVLSAYNDPLLAYSTYFQINIAPIPNTLADYITASFALIFPIDTAGNMFLALCIVLLPITVRYFISEARPGAEHWAALAWPLVWGRHVWLSNESFSITVCLLFLFWGLLARWRGPLRLSQAALLAAMLVLIFLGHFLVFLFTGYGLLIHLLVYHRGSMREWLWRGLVTLPAFVLVALWLLTTGGLSPELQSAFHFHIDPMRRVHAISSAIGSPMLPIGDSELGLNLRTVLSLIIVVGIAIRCCLLYRRGDRFAAALVGMCFIPALLLTEQVVLFNPDERAWWIIIIAGLVVWPVSERWANTACIAGVLLIVVTSPMYAKYFSRANYRLAAIDREFETFPKRLRLITMDFLGGNLHRAFEYYHIRHGGINALNFTGSEWSIRCRDPEMDIHKPGVSQLLLELAKEPDDMNFQQWLKHYDGMLVMGYESEPGVQRILHILKRMGYRTFSGPPVALMLRPDYPLALPYTPRPAVPNTTGQHR